MQRTCKGGDDLDYFSMMIRHASLELACLIVVAFLIIWDSTSRFELSSIGINQLQTFDQLARSIEDCNVTNSQHSSISQDDSSFADPTATGRPRCPIDRDRLKFLDQLELDRWLSYKHIEHGGHFKPIGCVSRQKVAIIVPYQDGQEQLEKFLFYIHQFLPDQLIDYKVFVVEQDSRHDFNRARLLNIGVAKIMESEPDIACFIFHEVDLMPLDQRNLYMCSRQPRHLCGSISSLRYQLIYPRFFAGVISMTKSQYSQLGGFSEISMKLIEQDENTLRRLDRIGLTAERSPLCYGVYITAHNQWGKQDLALDKILELSTSVRTGTTEAKTGPSTDKASCETEMKQLYTSVKCHI